ncbi:hypothetical protein B6U74_05980 [Candidatus Bathyarchaeota archaeon ex4484_205]|nr:MAG: hypothetical protein B6U74_05980 [Candidatus Bathyarchaeota archaeon ex4484_205]
MVRVISLGEYSLDLEKKEVRVRDKVFKFKDVDQFMDEYEDVLRELKGVELDEEKVGFLMLFSLAALESLE